MGDRTPSKGTPVSFMKSDSGVSSGSPVRSTFYGPSYGRNGKKDHYETPNPRRTYTIMSQVKVHGPSPQLGDSIKVLRLYKISLL